MSARAELRKGRCPGALRPMETGDGLLVRVRPRAGLFTIPALRAIADVAARYGSGEIDLTNRANLQMRGVGENTWRNAVAELDAAGLIDSDEGSESVRNVIVDSLFGLNPERRDLRPLAAELERRLVEERELHALPSKFGFSVGEARADIMISASVEHCALRLDGDDIRAAILPIADAAEAAVLLAKSFLRTKPAAVRRMRDAVAAFGAADIFAEAGLTSVAQAVVRKNTSLAGALGLADAPFAVGVGLPFGRITARQLTSLCSVADSCDARPSPSRVLVFPVQTPSQAAKLLDAASGLDLIVVHTDPRLTMDVCPGAPACRNATTRTRTDALHIAELLQAQNAHPQVHISGCIKGCARRGAADLTIVANAGRYDIIRDGDVEATPIFASVAPVDLAEVAARALSGRRP